MHLYLWGHNCVCGNTIELPGLCDFVYGELLLHNDCHESRYLCAIGDVVVDEVSNLVDTNVHTKDLDDEDRATIFQSIFGEACDRASDGSAFKINYKIKCPACGSKQMTTWSQLSPLAGVDVQETTYHEWNSLSEDQRFKLIDKAICEELSNPGSDINTRGSNGSLIKSWMIKKEADC